MMGVIYFLGKNKFKKGERLTGADWQELTALKPVKINILFQRL
jgi:hypothetical protein